MTVLISAQSKTPLYEQIRQQIRDQILNGHLAAGAELPSLRDLARDLRVSLITTKRAYDDLEAEGLLVSLPGRGTIVAGFGAEWLGEQRRAQVEEALGAAVDLARSLGLSRAELEPVWELLWKGGER